MKKTSESRIDVLSPTEGDSAVGVSESKWFVAIVKNNPERLCQQRLLNIGVKAYVPAQTEIRITAQGKQNEYNRALTLAMIFVYVSEEKRKETANLPHIYRFMVDRTKKNNSGNHPFAIIPNEQLEKFRFMLCNADSTVYLENAPIKVGDTVRVIKGKMVGLEGELIEDYTRKFIAILVDCLGCAKVTVSLDSISKV